MKVHLLIFYAAPEPFDEDVVSPGSSTVHADLDASLQQHAGERQAGELAPLSVLKMPGLP
jgi:hypothetical protein